MDENRFEDMIRNLPGDFKVPPEPPLEEMWRVIESAHFDAPLSARTPRGFMRTLPWLAAAAALLIGIGIGRYMPAKSAITPPPQSGTVASSDKSVVADTSA